jgi:hypothetical protein
MSFYLLIFISILHLSDKEVQLFSHIASSFTHTSSARLFDSLQSSKFGAVILCCSCRWCEMSLNCGLERAYCSPPQVLHENGEPR